MSTKLSEMLPSEQGTYYLAKIKIELAKTYASKQDTDKAMEYSNAAKVMLEKIYG